MTVRPAADTGRIEAREDGTRITTDTFTVSNPANRLEALDAIDNTANGNVHPTLPGFYVTGKHADPQDAADAGDADVAYKLTINYATVPADTSQPVSIERGSVQIRTQPVTVRKIIADKNQATYGTDAEDYGKIIGFSSDPVGVSGIDVQIPAFAVSIRKYFRTSFGGEEDPPGWNTLLSRIGTYNSHDFEPLPGVAFSPGEVLFVGPSISRTFATTDDEYVEYSYEFLVSRNSKESVTITRDPGPGTEEMTITKKGWQGIWLDLMKVTVGPENLSVKAAIKGVYVCDIYGEADLEDLNYRLSDPVIGESHFYRSFNVGRYVDTI